MFAQAVDLASRFTFPFVGLRRRECGQTYATIGAFVMLNRDGWALTSGHLIDEILAVEREVEEGVTLAPEGGSACVEHVEIWATPGFDRSRPRALQAIVRGIADLAVVKIEPFDAEQVSTYPVLRDVAASPIVQGMSVCRLGYPFHSIQPGWDADRREFALPQGAFPVPSFALDGVVARFHRSVAEGGHEATFIATSTPGLRGQSGGPLLDTEGRLCGIQSHTTHLDLGFDGHFSAGEQVMAERQFLNVGAATHVSDVTSVLDEAGIRYDLG
jgi:S1-C subfamily serine protease